MVKTYTGLPTLTFEGTAMKARSYFAVLVIVAAGGVFLASAGQTQSQVGCTGNDFTSMQYIWGQYVCAGWGGYCGECFNVGTGDYCVSDWNDWGCHVGSVTSTGEWFPNYYVAWLY